MLLKISIVTKAYSLLVLEAVDVNSLLEKFEASENPNLGNKSTEIIKNNRPRSNKTCHVTQECEPEISLSSCFKTRNGQKSTVKKDPQISLLTKNIMDKLEVIISINSLIFKHR